jgi:hypothetical protein
MKLRFMLLRSGCLLFLIVPTTFGQDGQFSYPGNFGSFPKHAFNTVQGAVHITLHGFAANSTTDWAMAANVGNKAQMTVTQATVGNAPFVTNLGIPPQIPPPKTIVDMKKWKDVRVSDGLIEINNLDALQYQALAISLTVPAGTNIIVQNDDQGTVQWSCGKSAHGKERACAADLSKRQGYCQCPRAADASLIRILSPSSPVGTPGSGNALWCKSSQ